MVQNVFLLFLSVIPVGSRDRDQMEIHS